MALGTRDGKILIKNSLLQDGCECCGEQACDCGPADEVRPSSLTVEFSGFTFSPFPSDPFLVPGDAEGQETGLTDFIAGLGEIELPLYVENLAIAPLGFTYGTLGCSTLSPEQLSEGPFTDVSCSNCPPDFYANAPIQASLGAELTTSPSLRCVLACDGTLHRRYQRDIRQSVVPERWTIWRPLIASGSINNPSWAAGSCGDQEWAVDVYFLPAPFITTPEPLQVTPLCDGWTEPVTFAAYLSAAVSARVTDNSFARYSALSGTVTITPNYTNPLP